MAAQHKFDPGDEQAIGFWDTTESAKFLNTFMLAFQIFLGVIGCLTMIVGGIGVSNIMNVVVEERTREIGIKMALGAKPRLILVPVSHRNSWLSPLSEAVWVCWLQWRSVHLPGPQSYRICGHPQYLNRYQPWPQRPCWV